LKCKIIVPAANVPCSPDGENKINAKGITLLPDFVINGGGIVGTGLREVGYDDNKIRKIFLEDFKEMIGRMLRLSDKRRKPATILARLEAANYFQKIRTSGQTVPTFGNKIYKRLLGSGMVPQRLISVKKAKKINDILRKKFI
jgi:hypothetical protein